MHLLQQLGWKRVGALMASGKKYADHVATLQDHAESHKITFVTTKKISSATSIEVIPLFEHLDFVKLIVMIAVPKRPENEASQDHSG